jgi:hypothetical protein
MMAAICLEAERLAVTVQVSQNPEVGKSASALPGQEAGESDIQNEVL